MSYKVTLTANAAKRIQEFIQKRGQGIGLRLGVKTSGCSGLAYKLEFVDQAMEDDVVLEEQGVKIFVDKKSIQFLNGIELDFVKEGLQEGFKFKNPNATAECGCGESFTV